MNQKHTSIRLMGGLGNQLFIYAFGRHLEVVHGHKILFESSNHPKWGENHGLTLSGRGLDIRPDLGARRNLASSLTKLCSRGQRHRFAESGFTESACEVPFGANVVGYFQSWRYAGILKHLGIQVEQTLREGPPSSWFLEQSSLARSSRPVVIHGRRGDYRKVPHLMGLVGDDYYRKAIQVALRKAGEQEIWVFSDEPEWATSYFGSLVDNAVIVKPPRESDPAESLVLMSLGRAHVISNSSFAWWGAFMSPNSTLVVAPEPWLKGYPTPQDLLPEPWLKLGHGWKGKD